MRCPVAPLTQHRRGPASRAARARRPRSGPGRCPGWSGHRAPVRRDAGPGMIRAWRSRSGDATAPPGGAVAGLRPRRPASSPALGWIAMAVTLAAVAASASWTLVTPAAAREAADAGPGWEIGLPGLLLAVPGALLLHRRTAERRLVGRRGHRAVLGARRPGVVVADLRACRAIRRCPAPRSRSGSCSASAPGCCSGCRCCCCSTPTAGCPGALAARSALAQPRLHRRCCRSCCSSSRPRSPDARAGRAAARRSSRSLDLDPTSLPLPEARVLPLLQGGLPAGAARRAGAAGRRRRTGSGRPSGEDRRRMRWLLWAGVVDVLVMLGALLFPGEHRLSCRPVAGGRR